MVLSFIFYALSLRVSKATLGSVSSSIVFFLTKRVKCVPGSVQKLNKWFLPSLPCSLSLSLSMFYCWYKIWNTNKPNTKLWHTGTAKARMNVNESVMVWLRSWNKTFSLLSLCRVAKKDYTPTHIFIELLVNLSFNTALFISPSFILLSPYAIFNFALTQS